VNRSACFPRPARSLLGWPVGQPRRAYQRTARCSGFLIPPTLPSSLRPTKVGRRFLRQAYRGLGGLYLEPQQSLVDPRQRPIGTRHLLFNRHRPIAGAPSLITRPVCRKTFATQRRIHRRLVLYASGCTSHTCVGIHSVPSVLFSCSSRPERHTISKVLGNSIPRRNPLPCRCRIRRSTSAPSLPKPSSANSVPIVLSSPTQWRQDSSSIVCMADTVIARGAAETPRLDNHLLYDDSEPNWNERLYFTKVEEKARRTGWHIDVGA